MTVLILACLSDWAIDHASFASGGGKITTRERRVLFVHSEVIRMGSRN